jgi:peroxiredoxin
LAKNSKSFADKDAELIALADQDVNEAKLTLEAIQSGSPDANFPILADPGAKVAKEWKVFGLKYVPAGGPDDHDFPSAFIINRERTIIWRYIGKNKDDRPATTLIISNLP